MITAHERLKAFEIQTMSNYPKPRWEPAPENETYEERQARLKRVYGDNYDPDHKAKKWAQRDSYDNRPKQHYDKGSHDPRSRSRDAQEWNERNASRGSNFAPPSHPKPQYNRTNSSSKIIASCPTRSTF